MVWDVSPIFFEIGPLTVRWYGLMFMTGFIVGIQIMQHLYKLEGHDPEEVSTIFVYVFIGTIVGARLGHCLFYEPEYYLRNPLEILMIHKGGLASHGGTIGVILSIWFFARKMGDPFLWVLDRLSIPTAVTACFIRLGNLFNSEILGGPTDAPWAVTFKRIDSIPRHPAQVYESICYLATFGLLYLIFRKTRLSEFNGGIFGLFLMGIFGTRFAIEFIKENQVAFEDGMPLNMGQLLSVPFFAIGLVLFVRALKNLRAAPEEA